LDPETGRDLAIGRVGYQGVELISKYDIATAQGQAMSYLAEAHIL
jgi:hypothetical protein